jgi:hypothetical protein
MFFGSNRAGLVLLPSSEDVSEVLRESNADVSSQ